MRVEKCRVRAKTNVPQTKTANQRIQHVTQSKASASLCKDLAKIRAPPMLIAKPTLFANWISVLKFRVLERMSAISSWDVIQRHTPSVRGHPVSKSMVLARTNVIHQSVALSTQRAVVSSVSKYREKGRMNVIPRLVVIP